MSVYEIPAFEREQLAKDFPGQNYKLDGFGRIWVQFGAEWRCMGYETLHPNK